MPPSSGFPSFLLERFSYWQFFSYWRFFSYRKFLRTRRGGKPVLAGMAGTGQSRCLRQRHHPGPPPMAMANTCRVVTPSAAALLMSGSVTAATVFPGCSGMDCSKTLVTVWSWTLPGVLR
jgi:hypothetical protein